MSRRPCVDRPGVHIVQTASLISAAGSSGSASETFDASVDFTISLDGEGNAQVTDAGSGAILVGESTGKNWGFTNINYNRNEDRDWQYNGEPVTGLNSSGQGESHGEMAVTYAAASRVVSRTNYGASAGNRGFAQDDMPSNMPPNGTVSAFVTSDVDGRGREFLEIRKSGNSDDYEEYDEWDGIRYVRDETGSFSHLERYTNDVVLHGDEAAVLLSDGSVMWRGSSSASLTSKIHYRQESEYDGSALEKDDPTRGQWAYDSNRKAEFDHTSTLTITILPVSDTLIISYAKSGDSQVSVTGHDEYDQPWEKSELELAFDALAATTLDSILGTTPNSSPASDTSQPNSGTWLQTGDEGGTSSGSGDSSWSGWFWEMLTGVSPTDVVETAFAYGNAHDSGRMGRLEYTRGSSADNLEMFLDSRLKNQRGVGGNHINDGLDSAKKVAETGFKASVAVLAFNPATKSWTSPGGLIYGQGSKHGNRVKHVLDHLTPTAGKANHSLFNVARTELVGLLDEAWRLKGLPLPDDPGAYIVDMGRVIGTAGESHIKLIVRSGTSEIISAYPFIP